MPTIQGLSCAQCKAAITADGVTCAACSAPHHWPCYAGSGHCASCQAAKPPVPFGVTPLAQGAHAWVAAGVAVLAAAGLAAALVSLSVVRNHPEPVVARAVALAPAAPAPLPLPPPAAARFSFHALKEQVRAVMAARKNLAPAKFEPGDDARLVRYPGRLSGFLNTTVPDGAPPEVLELAGTPVRSVFVEAEVRQGGGPPDPATILVEGRAPASDAAPQHWFELAKNQAPPSGKRWYRMDAPSRIDAVRVSFKGAGASLYLHTCVALMQEKPAGDVLQCAKATTIRSIDGTTAVLAGASGKTLKVPVELLVPGRSGGNVAVCAPRGALVARLSRDGQVSVFDPRNGMSRSWGTHVSSLHAAKQVQWLTAGNDAAPEWLNGPGAWTLLNGWQPPRMRDAIYSMPLEASAVLNEDGTATIYRPQTGMGMMVVDFEDVAEIAATLALVESSEAAAYSPQRQRAQMRAGALGVANGYDHRAPSHSQKELLRWLKEDVLPRFGKLSGPTPALRAGDRVWIGWRNAHTAWGYLGTLQITMLDRDAVFVRPAERGGPNLAMTELELPRELLPASPEPRVGQTLWLEPEAREP